jgi:hypothetical protein
MIRNDPRDRFQSIEAIKNEIASRSDIFIARQQLDAASGSVVPETEIIDPTIKNPLQIKKVDWVNDQLIITLSHQVPTLWRDVFMSGHHVPINMNSLPGSVKWQAADTFRVYADANNAASVRTQYEAHIASVNIQYAQRVEAAHAKKLADERLKQRQEAAALARRLKVLETLNP